jgi:murein DD-endopeptidase MepM/ murein hydrolase activator NlpD
MALYRLPFPAEANQATWLASGNWDVGGAHGPGDPNDNADGQCYAYDIGHSTGGKVLAARAGIVLDSLDGVLDDTNPKGKGAGNFVWIRQADGTMSAYCHLRNKSLRVQIGDWVPQGYWIASSGATGNTLPQPNPHLHFEVRTHAEPGVFAVPSFGTSLMIHFEDKTRPMFRPTDGESLSGKSNNVEGDYRQDHRRHCEKCRALFFAGNPGSVCAVGGEHARGGSGNYTLSVNPTTPVGQNNWRYCTRCHALCFGDAPNSRCTKGPGLQHALGGSNYVLRQYAPTGVGQNGWRWCNSCAVLWFNASGSVCPATGSAHTSQGSGDYQLHVTAEDWQRNWKACGKCGALFFGEFITRSNCAGSPGATHVASRGNLAYMPNYFLQMSVPPDAPGQAGWRWCSKCHCLWMVLNSGSVCPGGAGGHSKTLSGDYTVIESSVQAPGQNGWRWCDKCQGLWFTPFGSAMKCPAGGGHCQTGGSYWVQFFGHP